MVKTASIILAAGEGKRMRSALPKVCQPVLGRPMIQYTTALCHRLRFSPTVVVVPGNAERRRIIEDHIASKNGLRFAVQKQPLGTGHAVLSALPHLKKFSGTVLILYGDVPLLRDETIAAFLEEHHQSGAILSLMTMTLDNPRGYGRIVRDRAGGLRRIIEEADASDEEKRIREVNVGIYAVDAAFLARGLKAVGKQNAQGEYYLTDLPHQALEEGLAVHLFVHDCADELLGANSQGELARLDQLAAQRKVQELLNAGVRIIDPERTYIEAQVEVQPGAIIWPGCMLQGSTSIAAQASVGPYSVLKNTRVASGAVVKAFCVLEEAKVGAQAAVGPFAHLRPGSELLEKAKVGNFVEMKKARMGRDAKASHLSYLGDAEIGDGANVGAGTITCNYDGYDKYRTVIGANAFIGSDTQLVAPVRVGKGAIVGAGTTVTQNVPDDALALSRVKQENKKGWAKRFRAVKKKKARR